MQSIITFFGTFALNFENIQRACDTFFAKTNTWPGAFEEGYI